MTVNLRLEMWELALDVAFARLGLCPLQRADGKYTSPKAAFSMMDPEEARRSKRKYRKIWRMALAGRLKDFEASPKRVRKWLYAHNSVQVKGKWKNTTDPFEGQLLEIQSLEVGSNPSAYARGYRWDIVKRSDHVRKKLLEAAIELGLCPDRRNM